jgi:ABC-type nitrate/sulfonate/bicarbonate transport system permease component
MMSTTTTSDRPLAGGRAGTAGRRRGAAMTRLHDHQLDYALSFATVAVLLIAWYVITKEKLIAPSKLPSPGSLIDAFRTLVNDGYQGVPLIQHIEASLSRTLIGFATGSLVGVPLGLLSGSDRRVRAMLAPIAAFMRPIPPIAFIPLIVLWFGLGESGKIVLIFFTSFNYTFISAQAGAASTPMQLRRAAQTLGLSRVQTFFRVLLPAALPEIFTGLRVAMALSWAVVVAAELVGAQKGLGYMISDAATLFQLPTVFVGIVLIGVIGLILNGAVALAQAKIVHWAGR